MFQFFPLNWSSVSALAEVALVLINLLLLISIYYAVRDLSETKKSRTSQLLIWAITQMEEVKQDIEILRQCTNPHTQWLDGEKMAAQRVSHRFQRLAYMARNGLIDKRHFRDMWGVLLVDQWHFLEDWIVAKRVDNGEPCTARTGAFSRADFEFLAEEYQPFVDDLRSATNRT